MIRVLQVVTHMNRGGLETMLMNYYRHIDRTQVQFDFLTHRPYDGDYGEEIKALGGMIYHLPKLNPFSTCYLHALEDFFLTHKEYRIVHVHQDCMSAVILKAAQKAGVPVRIAHSHNTDQDRNIKYLIKHFYKRYIPRHATQLFACGNDAGKWMFNGAPFSVLSNAIDTASYSYTEERRKAVRADLGISDDTYLIGHVGRFSPQKNHAYLVDVFAAIVEAEPRAKLMLVGDDTDEGATVTKQRVTNLGLSDKVIFTGLRNDVADVMQAMDVFLFPSLYEGLPVTMIEAQASGLPCVTSKAVPTECCVTANVNRLSIDEPIETWVDAVLAFKTFHRQDTRDAIKRAGFDIFENALKLQAFYQNVLKE